MKSKPNIDAFLEGGDVEKAKPARRSRASLPKSPEPAPGVAQAVEFRKPMVMQMPISLIEDLKRRAYELSSRSGRRVTQQQLVEEALRRYLRG